MWRLVCFNRRHSRPDAGAEYRGNGLAGRRQSVACPGILWQYRRLSASRLRRRIYKPQRHRPCVADGFRSPLPLIPSQKAKSRGRHDLSDSSDTLDESPPLRSLDWQTHIPPMSSAIREPANAHSSFRGPKMVFHAGLQFVFGLKARPKCHSDFVLVKRWGHDLRTLSTLASAGAAQLRS